jgi:hypothetical protein
MTTTIDPKRIDALIEAFHTDLEPHNAHAAGEICPVCSVYAALRQTKAKALADNAVLSLLLHPSLEDCVMEFFVFGFLVGKRYAENVILEEQFK